jgi:hypothetical protein
MRYFRQVYASFVGAALGRVYTRLEIAGVGQKVVICDLGVK